MRQLQRTIGSPRFRLGALLVIVVIVSLVITTQVIRASEGSNPPTSPSQHPAGPFQATRTPAYKGPLGMPAIQPRASLASATGPHFTEADVRAYITTHRPGFTIPGTPNPVVISVQFMTAKQVSAQLQGESMGVPDDTLLCLVRVLGEFRNTYVPLGATPKTFTHGVMIFDAHTGNLLISSVG